MDSECLMLKQIIINQMAIITFLLCDENTAGRREQLASALSLSGYFIGGRDSNMFGEDERLIDRLNGDEKNA